MIDPRIAFLEIFFYKKTHICNDIFTKLPLAGK